MSVDACRKYLTEAGFVDDEVEQIINDLPNAESITDFVKDISSKSELLKSGSIFLSSIIGTVLISPQ